MFSIYAFGEKIRSRGVKLMSMRFFWIAIALAITLFAATPQKLIIPNIRSGRAELIQEGRLTILELTSPNETVRRVALTHPSDYRQGTNAPFKDRFITESPDHFLIFTDSFDSNPGNPQGKCGASGPGEDDRAQERFVHVVALGTIPHETLSVLVESCLLDLEAASTSPEWLAKTDRAGFAGQLTLRFEPATLPTTVYYVAPDGSVSRPQRKPNQ
jgi:hypothetical protein